MSRILLLGPSDTEGMVTVLNKALNDWISAWCTQSCEAVCSYKDRNQPTDKSYECISNLLYIADFDLLFRKVAFHEHHYLAPADEVFQYLKNEAANDLGNRVKKLLKIDSADSFPDVRSQKARTFGDQNVLYEFTLLEIGFLLSVPAIVHDLLPYRRTSQPARKPESVGLSDIHTPVDISVKLDMGKYSITTIGNLSEGDILASKVPINQEPEIFIEGKQFATARLAKESGHKAIIISKGS